MTTLKRNQHADTDVANMSAWGLYFQDDPSPDEPWYDGIQGGTLGVLGYINVFQDSGDSPIFWEVWHDHVIAAEAGEADDGWSAYAQFKLNWDPGFDDHFEPLADWELDLLGWNEHIAWMVLKSGNGTHVYRNDLWNLIAGS